MQRGIDGLVIVLLDTGELDIELARDIPDAKLLAPFALIEHPLLGEIHRVEEEVVAGIEREMIWRLESRTQPRVAGILRHQEPRARLHGRIGMLEVRCVQHGHAEQLELSVLVRDGLLVLVVNDPLRRDAPQRRLAGIVFAGSEFALVEFGNVAFAPDRATRHDARVILADDTERLDERFSEIRRRDQLLG